MKKIFKRKNSAEMPQADSGIEAMINKIQQQLSSLERKIDSLLSQPVARPPETRNFSKPFQRFDTFRHHGSDKHGNNFRERSFTKAICAECHKECEVPFKPTGDRPVYCKECFAKRKSSTPLSERYDSKPTEVHSHQARHFDKGEGGKGRKRAPRKDSVPRRRK